MPLGAGGPGSQTTAGNLVTAPRVVVQRGGLSFNEDKTHIVHMTEGFDFLGFNIRRSPDGKLHTKPSKATMIRLRARLGQEITRLNGANAHAVIGTLNPMLRGWAKYYRTGVS